MSVELSCCLCCTSDIKEYRYLQNDSGEYNQIYKIAVKYFNPKLLGGEACTNNSKERSLLCQKCWEHIQDFYNFQQTVIKTRTSLGHINVEKLPLGIDGDYNTENEIRTLLDGISIHRLSHLSNVEEFQYSTDLNHSNLETETSLENIRIKMSPFHINAEEESHKSPLHTEEFITNNCGNEISVPLEQRNSQLLNNAEDQIISDDSEGNLNDLEDQSNVGDNTGISNNENIQHYPPDIRKHFFANTQRDTTEKDALNLNINKLVVPYSKETSKKHFCIFCKKLQTKISRHLVTIHKNESEIKRVLGLSKKCKERIQIIDNLRKKGDFEHNTSAKYNSGVLIVSRQQHRKYKKVADDYVCCSNCKGFFSKQTLRAHKSRCGASKGSRRNFIESRRLTQYIHSSASNILRTKIFPVLRNDNITKAIRYDELAIKYGNYLGEKYSQNQHNIIRSHLRLLGRFVIEMKKLNPAINELKDIYKSHLYDKCIKAVQRVANWNETLMLYETPAVAQSLSSLIKKCGKKLRVEFIKEKREKLQVELENFLLLWQENNPVNYRTTAEDQNSKKIIRKEIFLENDIKKFYIYIEERIVNAIEKLLENFCISSWTLLVQATLVFIQIFNRRNSTEIERLAIENFESREPITDIIDIDLLQKVSKNSIQFAEQFARISLCRNLRKAVSIVLCPVSIKAIELIIKYRTDAGIDNQNKYVFIKPTTPIQYYRTLPLLKMFSEECGATIPESFRRATLSQHIETYISLLNIEEISVDDIRLNIKDKIKNIYATPVPVADISSISKLLMAAVEYVNRLENQSIDDHVEYHSNNDQVDDELINAHVEDDSINHEDENSGIKNSFEHRRPNCISSLKTTQASQYIQKSSTDLREDILENKEKDNTEKVANVNEVELPLNITKVLVPYSKHSSKRHFCIFCKELQTSISRHLFLRHKNEKEVKRALCLSKKSKERAKIIDNLRKRGDFEHNTSAIYNSGVLIVSRQQHKKYNKVADDYVCCSNCKGFFSKQSLRIHKSRCGTSKGSRYNLIESRRLTQYIHSAASNVLKTKIFPVLRNDHITKEIRYDELVIKYGNYLGEKYSQNQHEMIRAHLRLLGRFIIEMKKLDSAINELKDVYKSNLYDKCITAVRRVANWNETLMWFETPAVAQSLSSLIKKCGKKLRVEFIKEKREDLQSELEDFLLLWQENYPVSNKITAEDQSSANVIKKDVLSSENDIKKFYIDLRKKIVEAMENLLQNFCVLSWGQLVHTTPIFIKIFNRIESSEIERFTIENFENRQSIADIIDKDVLRKVSKNSISFAKHFARASLQESLKKPVKILLCPISTKAIEFIMKYREEAGIDVQNKYIFTQPSTSNQHYPTWPQLKFVNDFDSKSSVNLRRTTFNKHFATYISLINIEKAPADQHSNTIEQDKDKVKNGYEIPIPVTEINSVSDLLTSALDNKVVVEEEVTSDQDIEDVDDDGAEDDEYCDSSDCSDSSSKKYRNSSSSLKRKSRSESHSAKIKRCRWSSAERKAISSIFGDIGKLEKLPSGKECLNAVRQSPALRNRTPQQVKSWIDNQRRYKLG